MDIKQKHLVWLREQAALIYEDNPACTWSSDRAEINLVFAWEDEQHHNGTMPRWYTMGHSHWMAKELTHLAQGVVPIDLDYTLLALASSVYTDIVELERPRTVMEIYTWLLHEGLEFDTTIPDLIKAWRQAQEGNK